MRIFEWAKRKKELQNEILPPLLVGVVKGFGRKGGKKRIKGRCRLLNEGPGARGNV